MAQDATCMSLTANGVLDSYSHPSPWDSSSDREGCKETLHLEPLKKCKNKCHQDSGGTAVRSAGFSGPTWDAKVQKQPLTSWEDTGTL